MSAEYGYKVRPQKGQRVISSASSNLLPGEEVLFLVKCNNLRPMCDHIILTNYRVAGISGGRISSDFHYSDSLSLKSDSKSETLLVNDQNGKSMLFKLVQREDHEMIQTVFGQAQDGTLPVTMREEYEAARASLKQKTVRLEQVKESSWPNTRIVGGKLGSKASQAVLRQCHGREEPWLILVSGGAAGILAAFEDRLAIIKTGAMTSFMAGSLGGERSATFHFHDITGVEYNSGFVNGVLEILTPSYSGTVHKDYWRGTTSSRNADSNDPWTLSNCLPLTKLQYNAAITEIGQLRLKIGQAKQPAIQTETHARVTSSGLAEEVEKLAELRDSGILTEEEFSVAKQRLLSAE